jgi:hypothetical protein
MNSLVQLMIDAHSIGSIEATKNQLEEWMKPVEAPIPEIPRCNGISSASKETEDDKKMRPFQYSRPRRRRGSDTADCRLHFDDLRRSLTTGHAASGVSTSARLHCAR